LLNYIVLSNNFNTYFEFNFESVRFNSPNPGTHSNEDDSDNYVDFNVDSADSMYLDSYSRLGCQRGQTAMQIRIMFSVISFISQQGLGETNQRWCSSSKEQTRI
jgi:hypothetical protein